MTNTLPAGPDAQRVHSDTVCQAQLENQREFFNTKIENVLTLIRGHDANYQTQFANAKEAVAAALAAQEKAVTAAFLASEKAIIKAEDAQRDYNVRSNEFRGQLDDQAKTLMPRLETMSLFKGMEDQLHSMQAAVNARVDAQRIANEKLFDRLAEDIKSLRESRSEGSGRGSAYQIAWGLALALAGLLIAVFSRWVP